MGLTLYECCKRMHVERVGQAIIIFLFICIGVSFLVNIFPKFAVFASNNQIHRGYLKTEKEKT